MRTVRECECGRLYPVDTHAGRMKYRPLVLGLSATVVALVTWVWFWQSVLQWR